VWVSIKMVRGQADPPNQGLRLAFAVGGLDPARGQSCSDDAANCISGVERAVWVLKDDLGLVL
jgi:hypothetical protein